MADWRQLLELTRVRVLLFLREPSALFWVFGFPLVLAAVLGFAFRRGEVQPSRVGVLEGEGTAVLVQLLGAVDHLEAETFTDRAVAEEELRKGAVTALLLPGEPPTLRLDPTRPEAELTRLRVLRALEQRGRPEPPPPPLTLEAVTETGSRYIDFLFPGLLGLNLMGTGMWSIGFAVANLRQRKVLKRMLVTPMRRSSFLLSFLLARVVFLALELALLVSFGVWVLDVPFRAALPGFVLLSLVGALVFSGLGLLAVARTKTIEGASGMLNLCMMPMWLLSGVFFSYERFPELLQPLLAVLPLSALNDGLRAMMLDGEGLLTVLTPLAILAAWGLIAFFAALRLFRWE
jgi:ABC-type multidrug transport system permease subunit